MLSEESCQVSALYLIPVKFGVRFKMAKSPICPAIAVLELRRHATEVWPDRSLWIFHTIFCCRFPLFSLGNTLPPPKNFWGVKFRFFDFAISSYLSTDVMYLLSVWGRRYSPLDSEHAECYIFTRESIYCFHRVLAIAVLSVRPSLRVTVTRVERDRA